MAPELVPKHWRGAVHVLSQEYHWAASLSLCCFTEGPHRWLLGQQPLPPLWALSGLHAAQCPSYRHRDPPLFLVLSRPQKGGRRLHLPNPSRNHFLSRAHALPCGSAQDLGFGNKWLKSRKQSHPCPAAVATEQARGSKAEGP